MIDSRRPIERGPTRSGAKEQQWRRHVAQHRHSKLSVRVYCAQAGISEPSFYAWRRELAERDAATSHSPPAAPASAQREANSGGRFLPVTIGPSAASQVEVILPSGLIVRVPSHDSAALRTVLELLERPAC